MNSNLFEENLLVSLVSVTREDFLQPTDQNYYWSRVTNNVFGVEGIHARTGHFETPWTRPNRFEIPDLEQPFTQSIDQIIDQRAAEIIDYAKSTNKNIVILYSGGIDSTCIMSAFIKNLSTVDRHRVIVCCSIDSIMENPYFYETQIRNKFKILHLYQLDISDDFLNHNLVIHGDPADCITGPSVIKYKTLLSSHAHQLPWKDNLEMLYQLYHDQHCAGFATWWVNKVCDNLDALQTQGKYLNVKTISDWHWWNYFNLKWQDGVTRALSVCKKDRKAKLSRSNLNEYFDLCFFASDSFQIWSYQHLHELVPSNINDHKKTLKKYIMDLDGNEKYFDQKLKTPSTMLSYRPLAIDLDGVHYSLTDPGMPELVATVFGCELKLL